MGREDVGRERRGGDAGVNLSGEGRGRRGAVDSSSNVTFGQNRRSLESNYRYARWKLRIIYASSLLDRARGPGDAYVRQRIGSRATRRRDEKKNDATTLPCHKKD